MTASNPAGPGCPGPADPLSLSLVADRFKLLGDQSRLRILHAIAGQSQSVQGLCDDTGLAQPAVSHHLKMLRVAGVVACRRIGRQNVYTLADPWVAEVLAVPPGGAVTRGDPGRTSSRSARHPGSPCDPRDPSR